MSLPAGSGLKRPCVDLSQVINCRSPAGERGLKLRPQGRGRPQVSGRSPSRGAWIETP